MTTWGGPTRRFASIVAVLVVNVEFAGGSLGVCVSARSVLGRRADVKQRVQICQLVQKLNLAGLPKVCLLDLIPE